MKIPNGNIDFKQFLDLRLVKPTPESQTAVVLYPDNLDLNNDILNFLSQRNYKNSYIIDLTKSKILTQFIPQKKIFNDSNLQYYIDSEFSYFKDNIEVIENLDGLYTLSEGLFFRFTEDIKPIDQYTYYIMGDNEIEKIPNFQTLEVMLAQRNQNYLSVRVIEKGQMDDLLKQFSIKNKDDMSSQWDPSLKDSLNFASYLELKETAKSAGAIADAAAAEADKNIKAVKAEKDAEKAKAEQAKAEADAAKAQAQQAIEEAKAAAAKAQQAEAEAKQKEAEAEAKKAEYESKGN